MNSFFSSNKSSLILLIISAAAFTTYALLGIPINIYWYDAGMLFIPISFVLFAILIPTTISNYYGKLKNVKLHKFMSGIDFFCVFGLSVAQLVYMFLEHGYYGFIGFLVCFFIVITAIVAFFAMIVSFHQHSLIKNQNNIAQTEKKNSTDAVQKLKELKKLFDEGIITEEEFNEKKQKYIDLL